ncbi:hypothetical protein PTTG_09444 [Puccinia triticina 1-1 BBBD Race 1]|uniref:Uncharacterized protein n=1 Tax=Puccinia triticina (isolate 1-1 / race 1 (BBBD)) TaxID=630390 RepID=A0A180GAG8_PUCT1|nr:hypothetical protein PTTG_09444 [Puccinia triticina 1-1 BBBD Race 1]
MIEGHTRDFIQSTLGHQISKQSFNWWHYIYCQTKSVVRNPEEYKLLGRPRTLTTKEAAFMVQLVRDEPGLFLDELRERLYDSSGTLLIMSAVHENLVNHLSIALKKAETLNSKKCLVKKFRYIEKMQFYPANCWNSSYDTNSRKRKIPGERHVFHMYSWKLKN